MSDQGKVLVTGAAGTHGGTGGYLVEALKRRGVPVRAMVRVDDERAQQLREVGAEVVIGDFLKIASMRKVMEGVDRVFFCYPLADGLLQATANLCVVAREARVRAIANVSIMLAAPDQASPIARDHWLSENIFDWAAVKPIHLRGAFFFENVLRFARAGIQEEEKIFLPFGGGDAKLAWVGAKDLANISAAILANPEPHIGQMYEVTGDSILSIKDVAEAMSAEYGRKIEYHDQELPEWLERVKATLAGNDKLRAHVSMLGHVVGSGRVLGRVNDLVTKISGEPQQTARQFARAHAVEFAHKKPA
jgi:uncharacterized protein YbjT (DUF2867 family)